MPRKRQRGITECMDVSMFWNTCVLKQPSMIPEYMMQKKVEHKAKIEFQMQKPKFSMLGKTITFKI